MKTAVDSLSKKGKRAIGSLMGSIDRTVLKPSLSIKLFDSLIKPILLYGSQFWAPLLAPQQLLGLTDPNLGTYFKAHSEMGGERVQLRFAKWILGVNKKTTNVFTWGELGRFPLLFSALEQAQVYFKRVMMAPQGTLLYHTMQEQQRLGLKWWSTMSALENTNVTSLKQKFTDMCLLYNSCHSKTSFVETTKSSFGMQLYIQIVDDFSSRRTWSKLRGSASCLAIETGRYKQPFVKAEERYCTMCRDTEILVVEDEQHFLANCPLLEHIRVLLKDTVPTINGYEITRLKDKKKLNIALGIISKMYYRRSLTEKTTEAVELMAIDALLNTDKQQHPADFYLPVPPESPDYPVSMISCLPPKIHPLDAPLNTGHR